MNVEEETIKKILLKRACREIELLDVTNIPKFKEEHSTLRIQRLAYADQLILLLNDFNEHLCSTEIKGVIDILNQLHKRLNNGEPISDDVRQFMTAFYKAKRESVSFPSVDIIRKAVKIVDEDERKR